nr:Non reducing polyketide synthase [Penicillium sclerotiorum]
MTGSRSQVKLDNESRESTIFLFGPHVTTFTKQSMEKLIRPISRGQHRDWILDTLAELPTFWDALSEKMPEIPRAIDGPKQLSDLDSWIRHGVTEIPPDVTLPSIIVGPLVVLIQLTQYWRYIELTHKGDPFSDVQASVVESSKGTKKSESLGFCAGLLAALAVASSHNRQEFQKYGTVAVRLAMLIGALIDAREVWDKANGKGGSVSFATAWINEKQAEEVKRIIHGLSPEAYVAVVYDEARATVTTSEHLAPNLAKQLRSVGAIATEIPIKGHIHSPDADRKIHTDTLVELCTSTPGLQYADTANLALPTYNNRAEGSPISSGNMTEMVLRAILVQQCNWFGTFSSVSSQAKSPFVVTFGMERCVPPTLMRGLGTHQVHFEDLALSDETGTSVDASQLPVGILNTQVEDVAPASDRQTQARKVLANDKDAIAIVGMSVKTAGADDLAEFAEMLKTGESQHVQITRDMLMHDMVFREPPDSDPKRKYYGCFVRDSDAFDHKFFKRSPRESAAMDPQSRLVLETAYQAVEQSGYFAEILHGNGLGAKDGVCNSSQDERMHVGVYLGSCGVDYEHNISCYEPTAFTATGALKSFITGRISHYFGWTGPCMTFDTACSSSAVALHTACRNLLSGECTAALAGGSSSVTNMMWFQNLAAGSFASPTGQCKPFDDNADGYCRAEGLGFVFLKKLSDAVRDGNPILGLIPSTAVYQNQNCTPLFVPNSPSLSQLFGDILRKANIAPRDISLVEAHGTGTPVGDPAEYESIRLALGGPISGRQKNLPIGSVKGHIGHTEGASGMLALIKVLVMMRGSFIPPQASFKKMNHNIDVRPDDMMEIVTSLKPWDDENKIALINNYGACGSNASFIVAEPPKHMADRQTIEGARRYPFWMPGLDARAISANAAKLLSYCRSLTKTPNTLADLSFAVNRQSNRGLPQSLVFSARSLAELEEKLEEAAAASDKEAASRIGVVSTKTETPVILCFGGQVSLFVGLDRQLYDNVAILRRHLDDCDAVVTSLGLKSIYPDIFEQQPIRDTVKLQTMLFALQYSCAKTWMDCGLENKITAVVGHSFGEITALCVAGALSIHDTVTLVAARARLVQESWGSDSGAMMAVEADESLLQELLQQANSSSGSDGSASIACYNGPRSFTLAGSTSAIDTIQQTLASESKFATVKSKRLNVTNAFHSSLVDKLTDGLANVGKRLTFREPVIPIERATESGEDALDWTFVPNHMRRPVFFNHAVQRLAKQHPQAVFLEAGSNSTITVMAARALAQANVATQDHHFQAVGITNTSTGFDGLTDSTVSLWKQGLRVAFWAHHSLQTLDYDTLLLPPYQFDKSPASRHFLPMKSPLEVIQKAAEALVEQRGLSLGQGQPETAKPLGLWDFVGYQDKNKKTARFRINTESEKYKTFVLGHVIADTAPICPGTLECDMVIEALYSLHPEWKDEDMQPAVHDMVNHTPVCEDPSRNFYIDLSATDKKTTQFTMTILSALKDQSADHTQIHAEGRVVMRSSKDPSYVQEFAHFERLVTYERCQEVLNLSLDDEGVEVLQGRQVYRAFGPIVDYGEIYRGVRYVVGRGGECAGRVQLDRQHRRGDTWLDVPLSDSFSQVGGLWVNAMTDVTSDKMYIATGCELSLRSPKHTLEKRSETDVWHVYARHSPGGMGYMTDLFVFEAGTGALVEVMLGVQYGLVARASMSKMLARMTTDQSVLRTKASPAAAPTSSAASKVTLTEAAPAPKSKSKARKKKEPKSKKPKASSGGAGRRDITEEVRTLVSTVSGIDPEEMELDAEMADFGIDSLMGMELGREVERAFKCTLDEHEQMEATTLRKFVVCVQNALFGAGADVPDEAADDEEDDDSSSDDSEGSSLVVVEGDSESATDSWSDSDNSHIVATPITGAQTPVKESPKPVEAPKPLSAQTAPPVTSNLTLKTTDILEAFGEVKMSTDDLIREYGIDSTEKAILAGSNRLCAALVVEAFDELGSPLRTASAGQPIERVPFLPQHGRLMDCVYEFLEHDARLIDIDIATGEITRTHIAAPSKTSQTVLQENLTQHPEFAVPSRLAFYAGRQLAGVLSGKTDGIRVLFGSPEGRELTAAMYCEHTFNRMNYFQMREVIGRIAERAKIRETGEPLKILEMGAGTGGTTMVIAPFLESLNIPVEYTFTDLSPSMVANARRKFGKQYSFMRFGTHDIEKPPTEELKGHHIVLASNAIHATHNLVTSLSNVRQALRPDGFLMILEMTEVVPFIDLVFGLLEGWWLYDDGRKHAVVPAEYWEREMHTAGFGHVDWTDGNLNENAYQKVIMATASGAQGPRLPKPVIQEETGVDKGDVAARTAEAERLLAKYTNGWATPRLRSLNARRETATSGARTPDLGAVVLVTGATGGLGSHIVQKLAEDRTVAQVVCINRRSSVPAKTRQQDAFLTRGIALTPGARAKLRILDTDTSKPQLGLPPHEYSLLVQNVTHLVHNAWPMSGTRPVSGFEPQLQGMRNLLDLTRDAATSRDNVQIAFQFVSSIGVVGFSGEARVPERSFPLEATLPSGYAEGKWVCERMLDETLHQYPNLFRPMVVRPGQIAGSSKSGYWNPVEHFAFLVKSSQALRVWPDLDGVLQWIPVDHCAGVAADLVLYKDGPSYPIYHIDNPVGQEWKQMNPVLARVLDIPTDGIIPFKSWIKKVRTSPLIPEAENPAARTGMVDFLSDNFERMSCGGLILGTEKAKEHSATMANEGPTNIEN